MACHIFVPLHVYVVDGLSDGRSYRWVMEHGVMLRTEDETIESFLTSAHLCVTHGCSGKALRGKEAWTWRLFVYKGRPAALAWPMQASPQQ